MRQPLLHACCPPARRVSGIAPAVLAATLALGLGACGGGSGATHAAGPQPMLAAAEAPEAPPAPPAPPDALAEGDQVVTGLTQQAQANTHYVIDAAVPGTVVVTLPTELSPGDTVKVTGRGVNAWRIVQGEGQQALTTNLPGAVDWQVRTPNGTSALWWSVAASQDGSTLLAAANAGRLYASRDGGATWRASADDWERNWSAVAMSAQGERLAATAYEGQLWLSQDGGQTWLPSLESRPWIGVGVSADGRFIAAADKHGRIHVSADGGQSFTAYGPQAEWRSLAVSASGQFMVAGVSHGLVYFSDDYGQSWAPRDSGIGDWYRVTLSADGRQVAAVDMGGWIHVSRDWGLTWTSRFREGPVNSLASSGDGMALAAAIPVDGGLPDGKVHVSTDGGVTWTAQLEDRTWRGVAFSGDGATLVAAANGGQVYVSHGHRTTSGPAGGIGGGQGSSVTLVYLGLGRFSVREASGNFTVN